MRNAHRRVVIDWCSRACRKNDCIYSERDFTGGLCWFWRCVPLDPVGAMEHYIAGDACRRERKKAAKETSVAQDGHHEPKGDGGDAAGEVGHHVEGGVGHGVARPA